MMNWSRQNLGIVATESGADWVIRYVDVINQSGGGSKAISGTPLQPGLSRRGHHFIWRPGSKDFVAGNTIRRST